MARRELIINNSDMERLEDGDLVEFKRDMFEHWAVYIGGGRVVHLTGTDEAPIHSTSLHLFTVCGKQFSKAEVAVHGFWDVAAGSIVYKNNAKDGYKRARPKEEIVQEAISKVGEVGYNMMTMNCEHFASTCRYGEGHSDQVYGVFLWLFIGCVVGFLINWFVL